MVSPLVALGGGAAALVGGGGALAYSLFSQLFSPIADMGVSFN